MVQRRWASSDGGRGPARTGVRVAGLLAALVFTIGAAHAECPRESRALDPSMLTAETIVRALYASDLRVVESKPTEGGTTGAYEVELRATVDGRPLSLRGKWKAAPPGMVAMNNDPRKELAAWALQRLVVPPGDEVVPPAVLRCMPLDEHARAFGRAEPNLDGASCVVGALSYWVEGLTKGIAWDPQRFEQDPDYARAIANLNLIAHLVGHRDPHAGNLMISEDKACPRAFTVDNGLAFSSFKNPVVLTERDWSELFVPALPRATVERLRALERRQLYGLGVTAELRDRGDGTFAPVTPTNNLLWTWGARRTESTLQLGLSLRELARVEQRLRDVLARVDSGAIAVRD